MLTPGLMLTFVSGGETIGILVPTVFVAIRGFVAGRTRSL